MIPAPNHYQAPGCQSKHVSHALGLMGYRERWSKGFGADSKQPSPIDPWYNLAASAPVPGANG